MRTILRPSIVLLVALVLVVVGSGTFMAPLDGASASGGGPEMRLRANGCAANCTFALGEKFTLAVEVVTAPAGGYTTAQSFIDYGSDLTYDSTLRSADDEIVWPDCESTVALRAETGPTFVNHGCVSGLSPPVPVSNHVGDLVRISVTCSSDDTSTTVGLLPLNDQQARTLGTAFVAGDLITRIIPKVSGLLIHCGAGGSSGLEGDASCDGVVNPLDAALILQLVAGLLPALPCPGGGDPSGDGLTNPLDSALILQFSAGLISTLPP